MFRLRISLTGRCKRDARLDNPSQAARMPAPTGGGYSSSGKYGVCPPQLAMESDQQRAREGVQRETQVLHRKKQSCRMGRLLRRVLMEYRRLPSGSGNLDQGSALPISLCLLLFGRLGEGCVIVCGRLGFQKEKKQGVLRGKLTN